MMIEVMLGKTVTSCLKKCSLQIDFHWGVLWHTTLLYNNFNLPPFPCRSLSRPFLPSSLFSHPPHNLNFFHASHHFIFFSLLCSFTCFCNDALFFLSFWSTVAVIFSTGVLELCHWKCLLDRHRKHTFEMVNLADGQEYPSPAAESMFVYVDWDLCLTVSWLLLAGHLSVDAA